MKPLLNLTLFIAICCLIMIPSVNAYPELCLEYKSSECIRCPENTHVYQNLCYNNSIGCINYTNGDQCTRCNTTYSYLFNKKCVPFVEGILLNNAGAQLEKYTTLTSNPGDQYGQRMFNMISLVKAQNDNFFIICDNFMKKGEYGHFISRTAQPIISVHTYDANGMRQFKILYEGSGASLLLCLIGINMSTNKIELRSFVTIGTSKFVDRCIDYTTQSDCTRCQNGYHLQNGVCYQNIPGCISYIRNLCVECKTFSLLVQNRCISDCDVLRDTRSLRFYHNYPVGSIIPSLDRSYFVF